MKPRALIVDDERAECELFADALRHAGFDPLWVQDPHLALDMLAKRQFDVVVTDLNMPSMNGAQLCRQVKEILPNLPVVVVTAFGSIDTAVDAMRSGAYDFVTKPFDVDAVGMVLQRAVEHHALKWEVDALRRVNDSSQRYGAVLGTSASMRKLYDAIEHAAQSDSAVLISGERGTGKKLVARELHRRLRPQGPFVVATCGTRPELLLEGELFGTARDAGGASASPSDGLLASASGGTLLLDEICELPLPLQDRLSTVLDSGTFLPLGADQPARLEARVVATTSRDLEAAIEEGRFREGLFRRLSGVSMEVPPLRARAGDVLLLAQSFLAEIGVRSGKMVGGFTTRAAERLLAYDWPGNVRELRNCVERALTLTGHELVDASDLPEKVRDYRAGHLVVVGDDPSEIVSLEELERRYILKVVEACKGNKSKAARALGIGRKTLYRRLESFGVPLSDDV